MRDRPVELAPDGRLDVSVPRTLFEACGRRLPSDSSVLAQTDQVLVVRARSGAWRIWARSIPDDSIRLIVIRELEDAARMAIDPAAAPRGGYVDE